MPFFFPFSLPRSHPHSFSHSCFFARSPLHTHSFTISLIASLHSLPFPSIHLLIPYCPYLIHSSFFHPLPFPPSLFPRPPRITSFTSSSLIHLLPSLSRSVFLSFLPLLSGFLPLSLIPSLSYSLAQAFSPFFLLRCTFLGRTRRSLAHGRLWRV